jgi:hypothetical protein
MRIIKTILASSAAFAALSTGTAFAQCQPPQPQGPTPCNTGGPLAGGASVITNTQTQNHDVHAWSDMTVVHVDQVDANAAASGNLAYVETDAATTRIANTQTNTASASASATVVVSGGADHIHAGAAGTSNGLTVATSNAATYVDNLQVSRWGESITANARTTARNAGVSNTTAQAVANNVAVSSGGGWTRNDLLHYNASTVTANAKGELCCVDEGVVGAVAGANTITMAGDRTTVIQSVRQDNSAAVAAVADLAVGHAGNATATAAASANATTVSTTFAPLTTLAHQTNSGNVQANAWLSGGTWNGLGSASAYGVGNAHDASNTAGNLTSTVSQTNSGTIRAWSAIAGDGGVGNGGGSIGTSIAIGNANSATLCTLCGPGALTAANTQINTGAVEALSRVTVAGGPRAVSTASATGNAASFVVGAPGH